MRATFYRYATATGSSGAIDKHLIMMALDQWLWYWILIEGATISALTGLLFLLWGPANTAAVLFMGTLLTAAALRAVSIACEEYALQEVETILSDPARRKDVKATFSALV
jgi:hypothetical protein